jgi:hypothetical protein
MGGDCYVTKNLCARTYVDVPLDFRRAPAATRPDGDLLKDKTINAKNCVC